MSPLQTIRAPDTEPPVSRYRKKKIGLTETWLKEMESTDVYNMTGYTLLSKPRTNKRGGGVGMFVSSGLNFKLRDDLQTMLLLLELSISHLIQAL